MMLDSLIYTGAILLILSQVAEKITTFIRNYLKAGLALKFETRKKLPFTKQLRKFLRKGINWLLGNILILENETDIRRGEIHLVPTSQKSNIEFAVTKLGLLVGFALAFFFHADLFKIVGNNEPHKVMNWDSQFKNIWIDIWNITHKTKFSDFAWTHLKSNIWPCFETLFGFLATGFLLTFGSQFFHDLLDILYGFKTAQQRASDDYLLRSPDKATFNQRLNSPIGDTVSLVLERHKGMLLSRFKSIISIERVFDSNGESILEIRTRDNSDIETLDRNYTFDYDRDGEHILPRTRIRLIANSQPVEIHTLKLVINNQVSPLPLDGDFGTLGFFAYRRNDRAKVFVTCAHVIDTDPKKISTDGKHRVAAAERNGESAQKEVGGVSTFEMNEWLDAAVITLDPGVEFENKDVEINKTILKSKILDWGDKQTQVWVNGAKSPMLEGQVDAHQNAVRLDYGSDVRTLYNLLRIKPAVSQKGDSGAVVFDQDMNAVGMIIAGNKELSYAIPMHRVLNRLGLSLEIPTAPPAHEPRIS